MVPDPVKSPEAKSLLEIPVTCQYTVLPLARLVLDPAERLIEVVKVPAPSFGVPD